MQPARSRRTDPIEKSKHRLSAIWTGEFRETIVSGFLDSDTTNTVTSSRQYSGPNGPTGNLRTGLVTGFNEHVAAVPEASTWAMMMLGFAGVGFLTYRRRYGANAAS